MMPIPSVRLPGHQSGLSLLEFIISIAIGLVLIAGVSEIFVSNKATYRSTTAQMRLQENGRFALEFLSAELRNIGHKGCAGLNAPLNNTLATSTDFSWHFAREVEGFDADLTGSDWTPVLDSGISAHTPVTGSDVLTARIPVGRPIVVTASDADASSVSTALGSELNPDDVVMISDCQEAAIFQISDKVVTATQETFSHATGVNTPGNATAGLGKPFDQAGEIRKAATVTYFVRANTAGTSGLWRIEGNSTPEELIPGVENMQILYGINDGSGQSARYVSANHVSQWAQVMDIRIRLLVASQNDHLNPVPVAYTFNGTTVTPTDKKIRRVFTTTVHIRNKV